MRWTRATTSRIAALLAMMLARPNRSSTSRCSRATLSRIARSSSTTRTDAERSVDMSDFSSTTGAADRRSRGPALAAPPVVVLLVDEADVIERRRGLEGNRLGRAELADAGAKCLGDLL